MKWSEYLFALPCFRWLCKLRKISISNTLLASKETQNHYKHQLLALLLQNFDVWMNIGSDVVCCSKVWFGCDMSSEHSMQMLYAVRAFVWDVTPLSTILPIVCFREKCICNYVTTQYTIYYCFTQNIFRLDWNFRPIKVLVLYNFPFIIYSTSKEHRLLALW